MSTFSPAQSSDIIAVLKSIVENKVKIQQLQEDNKEAVKGIVEKFEGSDFANDDRNTIISGVRNIDISDVANRDQGYILAKFSNRTSSGVAGINSTFVDTDFPLFRLADVYLMYAECAARGAAGASLSQAVTYVNALRERANLEKSAVQSAERKARAEEQVQGKNQSISRPEGVEATIEPYIPPSFAQKQIRAGQLLKEDPGTLS